MYKNIIVPIDLNDAKSIKTIIPKALTYVTTFQAKLHFVYIIPHVALKLVEDYFSKDWALEQKEHYRAQIKELIKKYIPDEIDVNYYIGRGSIYHEIIEYSRTVKADLIIIAAVTPQVSDYTLGSNASRIVRYSGISVMVIR